MFNKFLLVVMLMFSSVAFAAEKANQPPKRVLFKNVNIFDGKNEKLKMGQDVLVENNFIKNACQSNACRITELRQIADQIPSLF